MNSSAEYVREIEPVLAAEAVALAGELADDYSTVANPELVRLAPDLARLLPPEILAACHPPRPRHGLFVLRGFKVADAALGSTPLSWAAADSRQTVRWDILVLLLASAMGTAFGWRGQQNGRLVHDIVPARGAEHEQTGASSSVLLTPHTEDAFHPRRANYLMLGCLRNHERIGTTAACVREIDIDEADFVTLSTPALPILPDDSYGDDHASAGPAPLVPTLWRGENGMCLRYDPAYTPLMEASAEYRAAYGRLGVELERVSGAIALSPGEFLVIDNDAVVHGRVPFTARYDGTDRWLKRVSIRAARQDRPAAEDAEHGYGQEVVDPYV